MISTSIIHQNNNKARINTKALGNRFKKNNSSIKILSKSLTNSISRVPSKKLNKIIMFLSTCSPSHQTPIRVQEGIKILHQTMRKN